MQSCMLLETTHNFQIVNKTTKTISIFCTKCGLFLIKTYEEDKKGEKT